MDSIRSIELVNMMDRLAPMFCFLKRKNFSINLRLGKITGDEDTPTISEYLAQIFHGTNKDNISLNQSSLEKDQRIIYEII